MVGLDCFVGALKKALSDGWQTGEDLPVVLSSAMADLLPALQGVEGVVDELKEDKEAFFTAVGLGAKKIAARFLA